MKQVIKVHLKIKIAFMITIKAIIILIKKKYQKKHLLKQIN